MTKQLYDYKHDFNQKSPSSDVDKMSLISGSYKVTIENVTR